MHVALVLAVGVVVDGFAKPAQPVAVVAVQAHGHAQCVGHLGQVVAIRADRGPGAVCAAEAAIHQQAGADVAAEFDVGFKVRMDRDVGHRVVVEVAHPGTLVEEPQQRDPVALHRQVAHQHLVARPRLYAFEQGDVALQARDQRGRHRRMQPPLQHCAEPVGVAVADVDEPPRRRRGGRRCGHSSSRWGGD